MQRKVLITITYNEMGIIIDTKAEEVAQPNSIPPVNPQELKTRWIPVSEGLPKDDEIVLGTNSSNDLFKTYTWDDCGEIKWYANGCFDVPVIAWMPLPTPYEPQESEE